MKRRAQGPQHIRSYFSQELIRGIFERRHSDPNAAEIVADWRAQGLLPPELPADTPAEEDCKCSAVA